MGEDLFQASIFERMRAVMRTEFGWSQDEVDRIADANLVDEFRNEAWKREHDAENRARLPGWIEAGYVPATAISLSRAQLREAARTITTYEQHQDSKTQAIAKVPAPPIAAVPSDVPGLTRADVLTMLGDAVSIMAALKAEIDELRQQVATLKHTNLAIFGEQKLIDQLTTADRDVYGVDIEMTLEEKSLEIDESSSSLTENEKTKSASAHDAALKIKGLASTVVGLNVGKKANLDALNEVARKMIERSKVQIRSESKGSVRVRFAKVIRGKREPAND